MIQLKPAKTFEAEVELTVPGQEETAKATFTFKYQTAKENQAFWEENKEEKLLDCLPDLILGWKGFDSEFTRENLKTFLEHYPAATQEILQQYGRLLFESRVKN